MFRAGRWSSRIVPQLRQAYRETKGLKYLNAAFADLDCYKGGPYVEKTIAAVGCMVDAGTIPRPSAVVRSGRGVWLMWMLTDPTTGLPPRSYSANLRTYRRLQDAICSRLAELGADPNATDAARVTRVPGSVHSGSGKLVDYDVQADAAGQPMSYTLDSLTSAFRVPPETARPATPRLVSTEANADAPKPSGFTNVHRSRLRQLEKLQALRGGFAEGCRNAAALIFAVSLFALGVPRPAILNRVMAFGADCQPALSNKECESAVRSGTSRKYRYSNARISLLLRITEAESKELETWQPSKQLQPVDYADARTTRPERQQARHKLILHLIQEAGGLLPSHRGMVKLLNDLGHRVGRTTVQKDYAKLGLSEQTEPSPVCGHVGQASHEAA